MPVSLFHNTRQLFLNRTVHIIALASLIFLSAVILVRNAWISDDAYITFRTIDNWIHGYGLTWNTSERVQAYTHPLWLFLLTPAVIVSGEAYYGPLMIAILVTLAFLVLYSINFTENRLVAFFGVLILVTSKPFIDFSVSGLENPLSHLLLALYAYCFLTHEETPGTLRRLSLIASLAALNRLDSLLIALPGILYLLYRLRSVSALSAVVTGFLPLLAWELFSLFYYGMPVPNTAYAKLNTDINELALMKQGSYYLNNGLKKSPVSILVILGSMAVAFLTRPRRHTYLGLGVLLYILYIIKIGGDYMSGRFLSIPFIVAFVAMSHWLDHRPLKKISIAAAVGLLIWGLLWPRCPAWSGADFGKGKERLDWDHAISDERAGWFQGTGLLVQKRGGLTPDHQWAELGCQVRDSGITVARRSGVGLYGYFAGPRVHIVDNHALTDPLLSRLPTINLKNFRIGHFNRAIPDGYLQSLEAGENLIADSSLARYYEQIRIITRGPLFSWARLGTIWNFNLGRFDYLVQEYLTRSPKK